MEFKVEILKYPTEDDWILCKDCTLVTVGKQSIKPPTNEWKKKLLQANHSPIRTLNFCFKLINIPITNALNALSGKPFISISSVFSCTFN